MRIRVKLTWNAFVILVMLGILSGCVTTPKPGVGQLDNAWHQYTQGMVTLENDNGDGASRKFDRALQLHDSFSPALAGKSLVIAMRAAKLSNGGYYKEDVREALRLLDDARKSADSEQEQFVYHVTAIRVYATAKSEGWLGKAQDHHKSANRVEVNESKLPYYQQREAADYFMALAWFSEDFRKSIPLLEKVLAKRGDGKWLKKANALYARAQNISRAASHYTMSNVALKIAVLDQVTRGDVAALLVTELKMDKLFAGRIPEPAREAKRQAEFIPADVLEHPFRDEVTTILKWQVRGLSPVFDETTRANLFKPQEIINRKNLALALEDVIIHLTNREQIATENIGQRSPFPDVPATVGWFNAVMTVTIRGLMKPDLSGSFSPNEPVNGADLLLAVFELRNVLNIH